jgi:uncharacterized protein YbjT (DUF2867 family)
VAAATEVKRIVLQSSQAVGTRPRAASHAPLHAIEEQVRRSSLGWTILRPGGFASNAIAWADPVRSGRTVAAPSGDVGLPVVDPDDIAEVAAIALHGGHEGRDGSGAEHATRTGCGSRRGTRRADPLRRAIAR